MDETIKELSEQFVKKYPQLFTEDLWFWENEIANLLVKHRDLIIKSQTKK